MIYLDMTRFLTHLTDTQAERLQVISRQTHIPKAELIRQAIDQWLEEYGEELLVAILNNKRKRLKPDDST